MNSHIITKNLKKKHFETFSHSVLQIYQLHELHRRSIPSHGRQHTKHISVLLALLSLTSSAGACNKTSSSKIEVFPGISLVATRYRPKSLDERISNLKHECRLKKLDI